MPLEILERSESDARVFAWLQGADDGVLAAVALAFGRSRYPRDWRCFGLGRVRPRWLGLGLLAGLAAAAAAGGVSAALAHWGYPAPVHPLETVLEEASGAGDVLIVLLTVALAVPFAEEAFFRGFAYRVLRARFGPGAAVVTTAVGFALMHGLAPGAWLPVVPIGLILALLVEGSGSLWPAVAAHATVNVLAVLLP